MRKIGQNAVRIGATFVALILTGAILFGWVYLRDDGGLPRVDEIGGPLSLVDHHGKPVSDRDYLGKSTLVFFGFTNCPNVCPSTLLEITNQLESLGPDADRLNVLFITVDPERDTPQQLALYRSSFDHRITGLSGSPENILAAEKAYHIYAKKIPLDDGGYTMDHTATVAMMNSKGQYVGAMHYQALSATTRAKLHRLLNLGTPDGERLD
jgi:protein SCO1